MKVKQLKEILEKVDPELEIYVWDAFADRYTEATFAAVERLYKLEDGENVYDDDDEPVMFEAFTVDY